jgi:hypothetical protein
MPRCGAALPLHNLAPGQQVASIQQAEASGYEGIWGPAGMSPAVFTVTLTQLSITQLNASH